MSDLERRKNGMAERHWTTAMVTLSTGLCAFVLIGVHEQNAELAKINTQLSDISRRVDVIDNRFGGYMPTREADAKLDTIRAELAGVNRRLDMIEANSRTKR